MPPEATSSELGLRDYLYMLRRRKVVIVASMLVAVAVALVTSYLQTPVYAGTAKVLLQSRSTETLFNPNTGARNDPIRALDTEIQVIESEPVSNAVREELGAAPGVSASPVGQTDVIQIVAHSIKPSEAARIANAYAKAYIDFGRKQAVDDLLAASEQIQAKVTDLQNQIDRLDREVDEAPPPAQTAVRQNLSPQKQALIQQQGVFKQRLDQVQVESALTTGRAQLVTPASIPVSPVKPRPVRSAIIAGMLGLLVGIGLAFLLEHLDDSIKTKDDVDRTIGGLPVVGLIPAVTGWKAKEEPRVVSIVDPRSPVTEAYRTLRTSIQFLGVERPIHTLAITSPAAQEGKTTTVANLGVGLSSAGQRVVITCCDLRRPRIHEFFGLDSAVGLTSVLLGEASISAAIQEVPGQERLSLLASGPIPPNPAELLSSARIAEMLTALKSRFDIVLIDCAPVLPVTDALILAGRVDAVLVACFAGATSRKALARTVELLRQVDAPLLGTVLNGASNLGAYGYAYQYYRYERSRRSIATPNGKTSDPGKPVTKGAL